VTGSVTLGAANEPMNAGLRPIRVLLVGEPGDPPLRTLVRGFARIAIADLRSQSVHAAPMDLPLAS
jgi:hypothetical protein